jgi:hypothetical protein
MSLNEAIVEDAALGWLAELGDAVGHGPHLALGEPAAERATVQPYLSIQIERRTNP